MKRVYGRSKNMMVNESDDDSTVKCRERRRRRMAMRRTASASASAGASGSAVAVAAKTTTKSESSLVSARSTAAIMSLISNVETPTQQPVYGTLSVIGRQRVMEDEVSIRTNLCRPEINGYRPVHFCGVFDGHGGQHVSALCKAYMHVIMEEELMRVKVDGSEGGRDVDQLWRQAILHSFQRMDEMTLRLCLCGASAIGCSSNVCRCNPQLSFVGSTAVVSLVTKEYLFVANCGDSHAVLCRNGRSIPLSFDHKPDRVDERARIEACGGRIMFSNGARVEGILAVSRAIGDRVLKQWVTSEPEISIRKRESGDEFLILASDGLWDVLSSELACKVVHECLQENRIQVWNLRLKRMKGLPVEEDHYLLEVSQQQLYWYALLWDERVPIISVSSSLT